MAEDKKIETIQDEIKLLKGEVKQSLVSVRDYLLNMELPSSEFSTILAALGGDGHQKVTIDGSIANALGNKAAEAIAEAEEGVGTTEEIIDESEEPSEDDNLIDVEEPEEEDSEMVEDSEPTGHSKDILDDNSRLSPEDTLEDEAFNEPDELGESEGLDELGELGEAGELGELGEAGELGELDEAGEPESERFIEEEQPVDYERTITATADEVNTAIPKVNMMANLITWISRAKKEIGEDQLPVFLEVYGISGHLSPELKEVIIHLAEIAAERPDGIGNAEVWSQSMLSLHGILTGGDAPLHPVIPSLNEAISEEEPAEEEVIEVDKSKESPVKLKLVFPNGDGKNKEFCIDFNPDEDNDDSSKKRKK